MSLNRRQHYSQTLAPNQWFSEFERQMNGQKERADKYLLIEDKCQSLAKLNAKSLSQLLETKVNHIHKWVFNANHCALVELDDRRYTLRREITRQFQTSDQHTARHRSSPSMATQLKFITLNACPPVLSANHKAGDQREEQKEIREMTSRRRDTYQLNSNEELMLYLVNGKHWDELDLKLRFYIVSQLEQYVCQSHFKSYQILPFGSSIAGLGTPNSDLDLVLVPKVSGGQMSREEDRVKLKTHLNLIADLLQYSIPFYSHFSRILRARIPIVKFGFDLAPIDIDLSIELSAHSVHSGVYMSAFLNYCVGLNPCVRDLILLLRQWAKQHIPPMRQFLTPSSQAFVPCATQTSTLDLLAQFFELLLTLRFEWEAISILNGTTYTSPDPSLPIWMENPFETELNMCRNIQAVKFDKFLETIQQSLGIMKHKDYALIDIFDKDMLMSSLNTGYKPSRIDFNEGRKMPIKLHSQHNSMGRNNITNECVGSPPQLNKVDERLRNEGIKATETSAEFKFYCLFCNMYLDCKKVGVAHTNDPRHKMMKCGDNLNELDAKFTIKSDRISEFEVAFARRHYLRTISLDLKTCLTNAGIRLKDGTGSQAFYCVKCELSVDKYEELENHINSAFHSIDSLK
ncbi:unnamed protein product [Medioppia subpectinata]|uniref:C2H2-type domain-containing protein n=1 Tax=Medioppia subpectinata TaxID=1979941 RepID=A0A7R9Q2B3_9ACAR|nr:unnamed protein product [Medioppia subpectinata]CAG2110173.1 unnamed protein product [Medioppia subpectinata]